MKKNLFDFSDSDDKIIESIAKDYPDMSEKQKESIIRRTRKKLESSSDPQFSYSVSGVEPAAKRKFRYIFGTAAAALLIIAIVPIAFKALKNTPESPEIIDTSPVLDDYNASPTEDKNASAAVTTKFGKSSNTVPSPTAVTVPTESAKKTTETAITVPPVPPPVAEDEIFDMLENLEYRSETCDGLADFVLTSNDGTTYQILIGCNHVWRNGREEADITPEILDWINKYGEPYKNPDLVVPPVEPPEPPTEPTNPMKPPKTTVLTAAPPVLPPTTTAKPIAPPTTIPTTTVIPPKPIEPDSTASFKVDWSMGDFNDDVWGLTYSGHSEIITNTTELREYLAKVYCNDKVEKYLTQYNDSYFRNNVLALNIIWQGAGTENKLEITGLNVSDREIKVTGKWNIKPDEVMAEVMSICLVKLEIPKHLYTEQPINWDIPNKYDNYYTILMTEIENYERLNNCCCERDRKILNGELSEDTPRLTLEQAQEIISENGSPENLYDDDYSYRIIDAFNEICGAPDVVGGSGITRYEYWLDDSGDEKIIVLLEEPSVRYKSKFGTEKLV